MKKSPANDFYIKVCIWTFSCLILAGIFSFIKTVIIEDETSGNESSVLGSITTIQQLQTRYAQKHQGKFAQNFDELIKTENLDEKFTGEYPVVNSYVFVMKVSEPTSAKPSFYSINADPLYCDCEAMHFYFDSILLRTKETKENRPANADDDLL
jgi:hypothetical protein